MAINLPPVDIQATQKKWTGKEISAVYGNAIEVSSNKAFMRGNLDAFKPEVCFVHRHRQAFSLFPPSPS